MHGFQFRPPGSVLAHAKAAAGSPWVCQQYGEWLRTIGVFQWPVTHNVLGLLLAIAIGLAGAARALAAEPAAGDSADKAIRGAAEAFVAAFNRGEAKEIAALWTTSGSLADEQGEILKGRQAIEGKYAAFFKEYPHAKIDLVIRSIDFPTPLVAIEDGTSRITSEHAGPPVASRYTAVHTLENGKWLMSSVRETSISLPSNFAHLQDLQWLIGRWERKSDDTTADASFHWIANKNFIQRDGSTHKNGLLTSAATQIIGWDPRTGHLRSWSFESSGGYSTGYWWSTPEGWRVQSTGILADGTPTSSIDCVIRVPDENDVLGCRSIDRRFGGIAFPNTPEVVFDRVQEKK